MLKIRFGNSRTALILFNLLVIKFPSFRIDKYKRSFEFRRGFWKFLRSIPANFYESILYGMASNISECMLSWYVTKVMSFKQFIEPVFTIGIINFQRYRGEENVTQEEIQKFYDKLPSELKELLSDSGSHDPAASNWRKIDGKLVLIDYGTSTLNTAWARFIRLATALKIDTNAA